jgi:hypothetical protein
LWQGATRVATRTWSNSNTFTMPASQTPGSYVLQVMVRTSPSVVYDLTTTLRYDVVSPPAG